MARYKHYLDMDVVTAARQRVSHLFDVFDTVAVMFSGGKDSLVCLTLCLEEAARRGQLPLDVIFLDEELLPRAIIDFIDGYRQRADVRMHWFAVPMKNSKFVLGKTEEICTWGPGRRHVRELPPWAITLPPGDARMFRQQEMDAFTCQSAAFKGRVTYVNGIRAAESLTRLRSVVNKLNENYICASSHKQVKLAKPIYDWQERDVFKFLHDVGVPWCDTYEAQLMSGIPMRVSTPLHGERAKQLGRLRAADPELYANLIDVFPDVANHARYSGDMNSQAVMAEYGDGMDGCWRFIQQMDNPGKKQQAIKLFQAFAPINASNPKAYPPSSLLKALVRGVVHRIPMAVGKVDQV